MIGLITKNSFENGYYEQAIKIARMVLTIVTSLGTVMIPWGPTQGSDPLNTTK